MITDSQKIKLEYEIVRRGRYAGIKETYYHHSELVNAYLEWANAPYGREAEWDLWCDLRDEVPRGTNAKIRKEKLKDRYH